MMYLLFCEEHIYNWVLQTGLEDWNGIFSHSCFFTFISSQHILVSQHFPTLASEMDIFSFQALDLLSLGIVFNSALSP